MATSPPQLALRVVEGCHDTAALVANFQLLKYISHPNLAQYVDVVRGRALRLGVVCEHYSLNLVGLLQRQQRHHAAGLPQPWVWGCAAQLLSAVAAIHEQGLVHHRLSSASVLICRAASDDRGEDSADTPTLKLADWCLHHTTAGGMLAPCLAGDPRYLSPEQVVSGPANPPAGSGVAAGAADIWSIGMILVETIAGALPDPLCGSDPSELLQSILDIARGRCDAPPGAARWPATHSQRFSSVEEPLQELVDSCLEARSTDRPAAKSLIQSHRQLASHVSASKIRVYATDEISTVAAAETAAADQAYLRPQMQPIVTVPPPPAVPTPGEALEVNLTSASEEAARASAAAVRQLREGFYSWLAVNGGGNNADAADALMTAALKNRAGRHSFGGGAGWESGRPLRGFPMMTFRDRLYSVAVGEDGGRTEGGDGASDATANSSFVILPASLFGEPVREDAHAAVGAGAEAASSYTVRTSDVGAAALTEPQRLSVNPSSHTLWDGCSAQERQQLRVSAIAEAAPPVPVPLRERHRAYQEARVAQFRSLIHEKAASADNRRDIIREARTDIPPTLRAEVWPQLLGISSQSLDEANSPAFDEAWLDEKTRKQIDVDLPRCHQENAILASVEGQTCLRLVLEAWLQTHSQSSVYCQGLDSLAAPFVILFYHRATAVDDSEQQQDSGLSELPPYSHLRPAVQPAYCCLVAFTGRYLNRIFASDSTSMLRAQLAEFNELLGEEMVELATHLRREGVTAELFAIPWLLTLFAHVLPLQHTLQLWDVLLAHADEPNVETLPLFVAISILRQSEAQLLGLDFNGILLYLSRLPPIDLDLALSEAVAAFTGWKARAEARLEC